MQAARGIPMQGRRDYRVDLLGPDAQTLQRAQQALWLALGDLPRPLLAQLASDSCLEDDDPTVLTRDQAHAGAVDHVVGVRGLLLLPKNFGNDAEHHAAIDFPVV